MTREIELKFELNKPQELVRCLEEMGFYFSMIFTQNDFVFIPQESRLKEFFHGKRPIIRIRQQSGNHYLTSKKSLTNSLDCIETEIQVSSLSETKKFLLEIGYHEVIEIHKKRKMVTINDWILSLDDVDGLGQFLEMEAKCSLTEDANQVRREMRFFLGQFSEYIGDEIDEGYHHLLAKTAPAGFS